MKLGSISSLIQALPCSRAESHELRNPFSMKAVQSVSCQIHQSQSESSKVLPKALANEDNEIESLETGVSSPKNKTEISTSPSTNPSSKENSIIEYQDSITPSYTVVTHLNDILHNFLTMAQLPMPTQHELNDRKVSFLYPQDSVNKTTLLLDLDETLVYAMLSPATYTLPRKTTKRLRKLEIIDNDEITEYMYSPRPGLYKFLSSLAPYYNISVNFLWRLFRNIQLILTTHFHNRFLQLEGGH